MNRTHLSFPVLYSTFRSSTFTVTSASTESDGEETGEEDTTADTTLPTASNATSLKRRRSQSNISQRGLPYSVQAPLPIDAWGVQRCVTTRTLNPKLEVILRQLPSQTGPRAQARLRKRCCEPPAFKRAKVEIPIPSYSQQESKDGNGDTCRGNSGKAWKTILEVAPDHFLPGCSPWSFGRAYETPDPRVAEKALDAVEEYLKMPDDNEDCMPRPPKWFDDAVPNIYFPLDIWDDDLGSTDAWTDLYSKQDTVIKTAAYASSSHQKHCVHSKLRACHFDPDVRYYLDILRALPLLMLHIVELRRIDTLRKNVAIIAWHSSYQCDLAAALGSLERWLTPGAAPRRMGDVDAPPPFPDWTTPIAFRR
ncbi:hypothetical protein CF326_g4592 [Tilletia indica]|nr:hypothetical protein CF326_g4592 [Tilletia indica]